MNKQIGIWIRVSTEDQAKGESPEHHEKRARLYAEAKEWNVREVYHLEAVSGKSVIDHPEAKRMLRDIKSGHITGLAFSKLARLARNTRELLDFADIFKQHNADLISLQESLDTSSPAGRFFYTLIAAMAEWERSEIAERVKVSIPIRAKLGKSLGGEAPYGYKWVHKKLELNDKEAPIRKLMYELFSEKKRILTVAKALNKLGHRTRRNGLFSATTVGRLLADPIAKGLRRVNYTKSLGDGKSWELKPKEEWEFQHAPAIISEELWDQCNELLVKLDDPNKKARRSTVHLFSGIAKCECGTKMYLRSNSPKYVCYTCHNKILPEDLEYIFHDQLKQFLHSDERIHTHLNKEKGRVQELETLLSIHEAKRIELKKKIESFIALFHNGQVDQNMFKEYHEPLYTELKQHEESILEIQSTIDSLNLQTLSSDQVLHEARGLNNRWEQYSNEEKRFIIDNITESITIGKEDIEIQLKYIPTLAEQPNESAIEQTANRTTSGGLYLPIIIPSSKLVQIFTTGMPMRLLQSS